MEQKCLIIIKSFLCVSGGYASFVNGRTSTYSDIDINVKCNGTLGNQEFQVGNLELKVNGNVLSMTIDELVLQVFQVLINSLFTCIKRVSFFQICLICVF